MRPTTWLGAAGLILLCLLVYLPGQRAIPAVDRDESRFAQASRQMLESVALPAGQRDPALHSGGLLIPRVQGRDRLNKPPLIYWLQAGSAGLFTGGRPHRDAIWMYRFPSLLAAIIAVLATWRLGAAMFDGVTGRLAGALLACCPLVAWESHQARADMVLLAVTTLAMLAMWKIRQGTGAAHSGWRWPIAFWVAIGLGVLTKGPITPLVAGLGALALCWADRSARFLLRLRPLAGVLIAGAIIGPWVGLVGETVGWRAYLNTIADETLGRSVGSSEGHWGPPGYHTVLLGLLLWPGTLMTGLGIVLACREGLAMRDRPPADGPAPSTPAARLARRIGSGLRGAFSARARSGATDAYLFCIAWVLPFWVVFELFATKLPHYTLPAYPALAILSVRALLAAQAGALPSARSRAARLGFDAWVLVGLGLALLTPAGLVGIAIEGHEWLALLGLLAVAFLGWNLLAATSSLLRGRYLRAQLAGLAGAIAAAVTLNGLVVPRLDSAWTTRRLEEHLRSIDPAGVRAIASAGFHEDSLVFATRGRVRLIEPAEASGWLADHPEGLLIVPAVDVGVTPGTRSLGLVQGFNYAKGRSVSLAIVERRP